MSTAPSKSRKQAFANHIAELMEGFAPVQIKAMFGGFGVYWQGLMFGLIAEERLYFKVDDASQQHFDARGLAPFTYEAHGKVSRLRYHEAPPEAYDEPAHMANWARLGYECAARQHAKKAPRRTKPKADANADPRGGAPVALSDLQNLGTKSLEMLAKAGIKTSAQLKKLGAARAYARTKAVLPKASLNLLWALEGALTGRDWKTVADSEKANLLMALEDVLRQSEP
jgi:DNA transformation protein